MSISIPKVQFRALYCSSKVRGAKNFNSKGPIQRFSGVAQTMQVELFQFQRSNSEFGSTTLLGLIVVHFNSKGPIQRLDAVRLPAQAKAFQFQRSNSECCR